MQIITLKGGYDDNFTYIINENQSCFIIDPALPIKEVLKHTNQVEFVIVLHSHFDHIVDLEKYRQLNIPIYAHESSPLKPDRKLKDNEKINFENNVFQVIHTPGHRFDCICLLYEDKLFTSDTLFVEGCGRADLAGSDPKILYNSLQKLKNLPNKTIIYPGHDYGSTKTSTIGQEKKNNKYFLMNKEEFLNNR